MTPDKIIVGLFGVSAIAFIYRFFLMKKEEEAVVAENNSVNIIVKGGYSPNIISIPKGKPTTINFTRRDPSSCLEEVMLPDFKIRKYLPLNKTTPIQVTPKRSGTFEISCGMNMFHGKIIVEDTEQSRSNENTKPNRRIK